MPEETALNIFFVRCKQIQCPIEVMQFILASKHGWIELVLPMLEHLEFGAGRNKPTCNQCKYNSLEIEL
jgi:hypothetical protein